MIRPFLIEPYSCWNKGKSKKKHPSEIAEEEALFYRMLQEAQQAQQNQNTANAAVGAGGVPPFSFFHPDHAMSAPSSLVVLEVGFTSSVSLTWVDNSDNEDGFTIQRSVNSGSTYADLKTVGAGVISTTDNAVAITGSYWYRVFAFNAEETSSYSNTASVVILPPAPEAPSSLTAAQTSASLRTASISWIDNSAYEDGFTIERSTNSTASFIPVITVGRNVTGSLDTTVVTGSLYRYRVFAFNNQGSSSFSSPTASANIV